MGSIEEAAASALVDFELVPDPLEKEQLSGNDGFPDFWTRGARISLSQLGVSLNGHPAEHVELRVQTTFHPPTEARFRSAFVQMRLVGPPGARIHSIEPVHAIGPAVQRESETRLSAKAEWPPTSGTASHRSKASWNDVPVIIRGSLGGSPNLAHWTFDEGAISGIGHQHALTLRLSAVSEIKMEFVAAGTVIRTGLAGEIDKVRNMVVPPDRHRAQLNIPLLANRG